MVVGIKDAAKLIGISVVALCAVFVCTMFLNFNMDIVRIKEEITSQQVMIFYEAQVSTAKAVSAVSGGCLLITSVVMLIFYIKQYIDTHKKELGILKALGYSNLKTAKNFWIFGISVFIGSAFGFGGAFIIMPYFYEIQNEDKILPEIAVNFHPSLLLYLVIVPTAAFSIISIFYACLKLKTPVTLLLRENLNASSKIKKSKNFKDSDRSFSDDLKRTALKSKKSLVFFVIFSSFCFSAMTQMSFSMKDLSSDMMSAITMLIGLVLAFTMLFLAITTVINGNKKTIAIMRAFGYSRKECHRSLLGCYRPVSYIGFAVGTVYQYALLRIMVDIFFKDFEGVPTYEFDFIAMLISLAAFIITYEVIMLYFSERIKKISVKEIMLE